MSISTGELMDARDILETPMQMVWQETVMNIEAPEPKTVRDGCRGLGAFCLQDALQHPGKVLPGLAHNRGHPSGKDFA